MEPKNNPIQVADKIFAVIELLAGQGALGLLDISRQLDLNKTTVHRILNSLIYLDYVQQDPASLKYRLSFKLCDLSSRILNRLDIVSLVRPYLAELVERTGETVHFVQQSGTHAVYIDKLEATANSIRLVSQLGRMIPLYCSGVGKALLADLPEARVAALWQDSEITARTAQTITDYDRFRQELQTVRRRGYALDNEENEAGIRCLAASLGTPKRESPYAFSISAPLYRMDDERIQTLAEQVLATKQRILREALH